MSKLVNISVDGEEGGLPINEFKLENMARNPAICMIAKRSSGKSWVCRSIMNHYKDVPIGLIIAPTDKLNGFYGEFFPSTYIYYIYESDILKRLLTRQKKMLEKAKKKYIEKKKKCDPRAILLMDDCLSQKSVWKKDPLISEIFFNGRHYQVMFILTMQYSLGITPELRNNFDYIFLLREDFINNQQRLYNNYAGMFPSFDSFRQVFRELTKNYGAMVISNRGVGNAEDEIDEITSKIYWFKAKKITDAEFGCKQFNEYHKNNYDPKWLEKEEIFKLDDIKKGVKIKVNKKISD